ncbi:MAG: ABC transporter ATP-binding protein [Opitutae bacterium]
MSLLNHNPKVDPIVEVRDLKTWFPVKAGLLGRTIDHIKAVDRVSLRVNPAEIVALVGESGCGKSTLGNSLAGLLPIEQGELFFQGNSALYKNRLQREVFQNKVQIIFQDPYSCLNPKHTVFEILSFPLLYHKICNRREVDGYIASLLEQVGMSPEYMHRYPHSFSGGQRQRISIARAIGMKPALIICDEIVSSLDVSIQAQIVELLLELRNKLGLALLFIAHDLSLVRTLSDRLYVMYLGKIVESGNTAQVLSSPQHPYTRALVQSVPTLDRSRPPVILDGEVPSFSNMPQGCSFQNRCPNRTDQCLKDPDLSHLDDREVRCFHPVNS